ncbi:MAG: ELWxxDGT repeat protein [Cytophagaceae bacterium]
MLLKDINPGVVGSNPSFLFQSGDVIFFQASTLSAGGELWKTDGTPEGTVMVKDIRPGNLGSAPGQFINVNGIVYFTASTDVEGTELWKTDGTANGTVLVKDINPGGATGWGNHFLSYNNTLYFAADDGVNGLELWKTDGTAEGTVMVKDIAPGASTSAIANLTLSGDYFYFRATNSVDGVELWKSDGTAEGTFLLKDVYPGPTGGLTQFASFLKDINGTLFFQANDGTHGLELWVTDGTEAGTRMVKDINPGVDNSMFTNTNLLTNYNGKLVFTANNGTNGFELWTSDGTETGTYMVADINPGAGNGSPNFYTPFQNELIFGADNGTNGREPMKIGSIVTAQSSQAYIELIRNVYPNPGSGVYYFELNDNIGPVQTTVLNCEGKVVHETSGTSVDISKLPDGIYTLKTTSGNEVHYNRVVKVNQK